MSLMRHKLTLHRTSELTLHLSDGKQAPPVHPADCVHPGRLPRQICVVSDPGHHICWRRQPVFAWMYQSAAAALEKQSAVSLDQLSTCHLCFVSAVDQHYSMVAAC